MSKLYLEENVGEIALRNDECFWIIPSFYMDDPDTNIDLHSPWFSFIGEKWRFILSQDRYRSYYSTLYLWRKFRRDLQGRKYTVQLKLKTIHGEVTSSCEGDFDCDYGFQANDFFEKENLTHKDGLTKIFFSIEEKISEEDHLCTATEKNDEKDINIENEAICDDEVFSDEEVSSDEEKDERRSALLKDRGIQILLDDLKQVFTDGRMTDAVVKVDGGEFKVHKVILVARSPVFASMFEHDMAEKKDNTVDIPDCTAESFKVFLHYLYSGSVATLSDTNVYNVYYAADKYRVDDLKERCLKFMIDNISVEIFCDVIALALRHEESKLQKRATDFFCQNIKKIIKTVQWQKYMDENSTHANELIIKALNA